MINRCIEVTDEYIKQLEHEIDDLKAINEEHKKINGKLREDTQKYKEVIDKAINFIDNYMYENYCYVGSEDKLKDILKEVKTC